MINQLLTDIMLRLDRVAETNKEEPSAGDLERIIGAYRDCREERDRYKTALEQIESGHECDAIGCSCDKVARASLTWKVEPNKAQGDEP